MYAKTTVSEIRYAAATIISFPFHKSRVLKRTSGIEKDRVFEEFEVACAQGEALCIHKKAVLYSSLEKAVAVPAEKVLQTLTRLPSMKDLLLSQKREWKKLWTLCDIEINESQMQRLLRLHIFHLLQTASPNSVSQDTGIPGRGLHGEGYLGSHILGRVVCYALL